ncbi:hypothetical protein [Secundilactobacillus similis]|nr:hypothetical protein [Secundilactobacillus similis]
MPDNKFTGSSKISVRVSGKALNPDEGYNLDSVITSLQNVENLIKKTYLVANDRSRFTENDAQSINIKLQSWEQGSLISNLEIWFNSVVLPTLPFVVDNREFIWESIKGSVDFLRAKFNAEKEGKSVDIRQNTDGGTAINVKAEGNSKVVIYAPQGLPATAERLQPTLQELTQQIDGTDVTSIDFSDKAEDIKQPSKVVSLNNSDKDLFGSATFTSDEQVEIVGKITSGNYDTNAGRIEVLSSATQRIEVGQSYRLKISEDLHAEDKWKEMFLSPRPYFCKYKLGGPSLNKVTEIIVTDWDESKWDDEQAV